MAELASVFQTRLFMKNAATIFQPTPSLTNIPIHWCQVQLFASRAPRSSFKIPLTVAPLNDNVLPGWRYLFMYSPFFYRSLCHFIVPPASSRVNVWLPTFTTLEKFPFQCLRLYFLEREGVTPLLHSATSAL